MRWRWYGTEVRKGDFDALIAAFAAWLETPADSIKEGITEECGTDGYRSFAYDRASGFFSSRIIGAAGTYDFFVVTPSKAAPRIGLSMLAPADTEIPLPLQQWLQSDSLSDAGQPGFTTLAALLASQGTAVQQLSPETSALTAEVDYLQQLLREQGEELRQVKAKLRDARISVQSAGVGLAVAIPKEFDDWRLEDLGEWCAQNEDHIVVLPRARNGAKKSKYEDPGLIFTALKLLAGPYRELRRGNLTSAEFEELMLPTGLRFSGSVAPHIAGEQGDAYFVSWARQKRFLDLHLLKGGGRDERFCFRLYFFWDEQSERAVVGAMPAHLSNSLS